MKKKIIRIIIIAFIIAIGLEVTLFNIKHYRSLFYPKSSKHVISQNINKTTTYNENNVQINTIDNADIEITNINKKVYNIYIDGSFKEPCSIKISMIDEGNG